MKWKVEIPQCPIEVEVILVVDFFISSHLPAKEKLMSRKNTTFKNRITKKYQNNAYLNLRRVFLVEIWYFIFVTYHKI